MREFCRVEGMKNIFLSVMTAVFLVGACSRPAGTGEGEQGSARASADAITDNAARQLKWEDLVPEGEEERLAELYRAQAERARQIEDGAETDIATQIGSDSTVPDFDGLRVRLPGYTVPFEYGVDAEITEFLLVPYFGACLHAPPPPPNQTIYVTTEKPIKLADLAQAVWIEGTLHTSKQETLLADAAYTIVMTDIVAY